MEFWMFQVRTALPPIPRQASDVFLKQWIEIGMPPILPQRSDGCPYCPKISGIADTLRCCKDQPLRLCGSCILPAWKPMVKSCFHMECAHLVDPMSLCCKRKQAAMIIAHHSDNPFLHFQRNVRQCRLPVLEGFPAGQGIDDCEHSRPFVDGTQEEDGDRDR